MSIYEFDPDPAPDSEFVTGGLGWMVAGNRGRLLDARRTPVEVINVTPERGTFEVEILAFEDAGRRWELGLEDVTHFQFARDATMAAPDVERELHAAQQRFDVETVIEADPAAYARSSTAIERERAAIHEAVAFEALGDFELDAHVRTREGHPGAIGVAEEWLSHRGALDVDHLFADAFVANPSSGEQIKAHSIVLAELGLCRYDGKVIRDPLVFESVPKPERAEHIIIRLALMRELYARLTAGVVRLFRAAAVEGPLPARSPHSFVSATFSREVAEDHFAGGPKTDTAVMWRQQVPADRVFMTFLETATLNRQFKEAEAILIGSPGNRAF